MNRHTVVGLLVLVLGASGTLAEEFREDTEAATRAAEASLPEKEPPAMSSEARIVGDPSHPDPPPEGYFAPGPSYDDMPYSADDQLSMYGGKHLNPTAQPPIQLGRRLYDRGAYTTRPTFLGRENPIAGHAMAYGDLRVAAALNDDGEAGLSGDTDQSRVAVRLNLDLDFKITDTERIHLFVRPFDDAGSFTRYDISGGVEDEFTDELDFKLDTLFFEGDVGSILSGWTNETKSFDLPFAFGLVPLVTQNGVWIEDAFVGGAFSLTARNSSSLDISNFDITFFAGFDKVTTGAVVDDRDANVYGLAGFMDLRQGYLEYGYGFVDADTGGLSYHNVTAAFSKRYGHFVSNSIRVIANLGQSPDPGFNKTADGVLLLIENSLITSKPSTLIPYINLFAGFDTPQSLARTADSGGVLRNTGINFETDGVTGYPTLDASGHDAYGGAFGVEYLFNLNRQLIVEVAALDRSGDLSGLGAEYALGVRFQEPLTNAWILRADAMVGFRDDPQEDISGVRLEIRRKF